MRQRHVGPDALARALSSGAPVRVVLVRRGADAEAAAVAERARDTGARILVVSRAEISRLVGGGGTADVLAMSGPDPAATLNDAMREPGAAWLLVGLAFPGNVGLALRTAEVSGAVAVAVAPPARSPSARDPTQAGVDRGPQDLRAARRSGSMAAYTGAARRAALRASIGAHRFLPVHWTTADAALAAARSAGRRIIAMESSGTKAPWDADLRGNVLLVAGGERGGVPQAVLDAADVVIRLPTAGLIPSYNVAAAVAAVAAEHLRQQST